MIVRKRVDGGLIVIGQTDHSRLVGQLAANWGNSSFAVPDPYEAVVRAAVFHDYGWLRYETSPKIDPATGEPYTFLKVPLTEEQMGSYQWGLDWMTSIDRYAGLIVNTHRTGLWKGRYGTINHPASYNLANPTPAIQDFIVRNEAWQKEERERLNDARFWTNYRLLQVWDLLGLYFCCQELYDDYIDPVPTDYSSGDMSGPRLTMKALSKTKVAFEPYPFDARPCHIQLAHKYLQKQAYSDLAAFRRAYFQAENRLFDFEVV